MAQVSIKNLTKSYDGKVKVLDGVDLEIAQGEVVFMLGTSGCGKSTLLRILAGLIAPDSGTISFDGQNILTLPPENAMPPWCSRITPSGPISMFLKMWLSD